MQKALLAKALICFFMFRFLSSVRPRDLTELEMDSLQFGAVRLSNQISTGKDFSFGWMKRSSG